MENSPLGRLAPELRNRIYELVFGPPKTPSTRVWLEYISAYNDLTRTCRQLRHETHAMFYTSHAFYQMVFTSTDATRLCALLQLLGPEVVSQLRSLDVAVHDRNDRRLIELSRELSGPLLSTDPDACSRYGPCVRETRDELRGTLAGMGLEVAIEVHRATERWVLSKPALEFPEAIAR